MWGKAEDGQYATDFGTVRDRASAAGTTAIVSEFGHPLAGSVSDKAPTVLKAMYQALDSRLPGASWWSNPAASGPVLSGTQWQWDIYNGRHHELMNDNPDKVLTTGDAWNDEDLSAVRLDDSGTAVLRQDARLLDRVYPSATAGTRGRLHLRGPLPGRLHDTDLEPGPELPAERLPARGIRASTALLVWRSDGTQRADGTASPGVLPDVADHGRLRPRYDGHSALVHPDDPDRRGARAGRHR